MASTPTARNRLNRQGTGDNAGTWGSVLNAQAFDLIDELADGLTVIAVSGSVTLTATNYASDQSRRRVLKTTGTGGTVTIPGVEKWYIVHNTCAGAITIKTASGAGATIQPAQLSFVYCDGMNCFGATYTGSSEFVTKIVGPASNASRASFNAPPGTAPSSPAAGDFWITNASGFQYRANDLTLGPGADLITGGLANFDSAIDVKLRGTYRSYVLVLSNLTPATVGVSIALRVSINGGGAFRAGASDYRYVSKSIRSDISESMNGGDNSSVVLSDSMATSGQGGLIEIMIDRPNVSSFYKPVRFLSSYRDSSARMVFRSGAGQLIGSSAEITDLRVFATAGTIFSHYALYGCR